MTPTKPAKIYLTIFGAALLLVGCVSVGREFNAENAAKIQKGVTTKAEVQALVGLPQQITMGTYGFETWSYLYVHSTAKGTSFIPIAGAFMGGANSQNQVLMVMFDQAGVVTNSTLSYGAMSVDTGATAGQAPATPGIAK